MSTVPIRKEYRTLRPEDVTPLFLMYSTFAEP